MPRKSKPRVHKENSPLAELPDDHPARRVLVALAECRRDCVGREIRWISSDYEPIEQEWRSKIDGALWRFSGIAYAYISFDLILRGWIERPNTIATDELLFFEQAPRMRALLKECLHAAQKDKNERVLPLIHQIEDFIRIWEESVHFRLREDKIAFSEVSESNASICVKEKG